MNLRKVFLKFWPMILIIALWAIFSSPYFFQQKVPYPAKYQATFFSPWSYYQEFWGPVKNNAMPDVVDQIYPWKFFTIQSLKHGEIPYWNPYNFAGTPHLANFQTAVFSPFNLLFFVLPFVDAWSILILLQVLLAGSLTYFYMRELSVSKVGSVISSIAFMFCGFMIVWLAYGTLSMAIALLPLVLYTIERAFHKKGFWVLPLLSISLAASFFSGHVQTSLYLTVFSSLYLLFKFITTRNWKKFLFVLIFFILGIALSLFQVLPTFELYEQSVRSGLVYQGGQIPLQYLVTSFAPDFYGNPVTRNDWMGYYAEWASFIGIIPLFLALFSLVKPQKIHVYFFAGIGTLVLFFASDTLLRQLLALSGIPVFATSIPSRMIVLWSFSFALLAGFGFDTLKNLIEQNSKKRIIVTICVITALLLTLWVSLQFFHVLPDDKFVLAKRNLLLPTLFFFLVSVTIFVVMGFKYKKRIYILGVVLLFLVSFDSMRFATKWMPFDERTLVFPDIPVIHEIQQRIENGRVFGSLGTQVESYYGLASLEGYDPLYIGRYGEFIRSSDAGKYLPAERSVAQLQSRGKYTERVLDLLGVNIIFHPRADSYQEWAFPVWENRKKYTMIYEDEKFQLFKNNTALPRATLFYDYEVIKDGKKLLNRFYTEDFDYRNILLLEEDPEVESIRQAQDKNGKTKIISYTPNKVVISVFTEKPALVFLSDSFYPNWKALVNGKEVKIYRADYAFRAVSVPEGESTIEFVYKRSF